jgi:predicted alpha/beta-hydrolase family hydrolase
VFGLVLFSFPLHQPGKPDTKTAVHIASVTVPMLFLSVTRDELASTDLPRPVCKRLGRRATLQAVETADHGNKILKRSRAGDEDVFAEIARVVRESASGLAR